MDRRNPLLRQQQYVTQKVSVNTKLTGQDAYKVWTHTIAGTRTFTLPKATQGAGPFYFNMQGATNVITVAPASAADQIGQLPAGTSQTLSGAGAWLGLYCTLAGSWEIIEGGSDGTIFNGYAANNIWTGTNTFSPVSGVAVTINSVSGQDGLDIFGIAGQAATLSLAGNGVSAANGFQLQYSTGGNANLNLGGAIRIRITGGSGAVTIFTPTSATNALTVTAFAGTTAILATAGAVGDHVLTLNGFTAGRSTINWAVNSASVAFTGINNAIGDLIAGTTLQTFCIRTQNVAFAVSTNSGANAALNIDTSNGAAFRGNVGFNGVGAQAASVGWGAPTGAATVTNFPGGGPATLAQCSNAIAQIITQLIRYGLFGA